MDSLNISQNPLSSQQEILLHFLRNNPNKRLLVRVISRQRANELITYLKCSGAKVDTLYWDVTHSTDSPVVQKKAVTQKNWPLFLAMFCGGGVMNFLNFFVSSSIPGGAIGGFIGAGIAAVIVKFALSGSNRGYKLDDCISSNDIEIESQSNDIAQMTKDGERLHDKKRV